MVRVEIISGGYGLRRPNGLTKTILRGECCEVTETEAERLVSIGAARIVEAGVASASTEAPVVTSDTESEEESTDTPEVEEPAAGVPDALELESMTKAQLLELAEQMGVPVTASATKAAIIAQLTAVDDAGAALGAD